MSDETKNPKQGTNEPVLNPNDTENGTNSPAKQPKLTAEEKKAIKAAEKKAAKIAAVAEKAARTIAQIQSDEPTIRKTGNLPKSHLAIGLLGQKVSQSWPLHFANLVVPEVDYRDLGQDATELLRLVQQSGDIASQKLENTLNLSAINALIDTGATAIKAAIKLTQPAVKNLSAVYVAYGMEIIVNKGVKFAADNSVRSQQLVKLLAQLQTPNNSILNLLQAPFTFADWRNLQIQHAAAWAESENLRQTRSNTAMEVANLYEKIKNQLNRVAKYMTAIYDRQDIARKKRLMGFLKESF